MNDTEKSAAPEPAQQDNAPAPSKPYVDPSLLNEESDKDLTAELEEMKDKYLRAMAEVENQRRRSERDLKEASTYAIAKFANDMVSIADNLRRALDTVPEEAKIHKATSSILEGVELTERSLLQVLERYGVKKIEAMGTKFDPHQHQAMFEIESKEASPGTVVQIVQTGYMIGDRVLRPALVGVAKAASSAA